MVNGYHQRTHFKTAYYFSDANHCYRCRLVEIPNHLQHTDLSEQYHHFFVIISKRFRPFRLQV